MAVNAPAQIDRQRIKELIEREEKALNAATRKSEEMYKRAHAVLSGGVASSYQLRDPWPIYLERGKGPKVWDVDGNEMYDFHNGFGSMVQGHAHPAIRKAIGGRLALGTHLDGHTSRARGAPAAPRGAPRGPGGWWGTSGPAAGACPSGASRTPAASRRWTRSA